MENLYGTVGESERIISFEHNKIFWWKNEWPWTELSLISSPRKSYVTGHGQVWPLA